MKRGDRVTVLLAGEWIPACLVVGTPETDKDVRAGHVRVLVPGHGRRVYQIPVEHVRGKEGRRVVSSEEAASRINRTIQKVRAGELGPPVAFVPRVGPGRGLHRCDGCGDRILSTDLQHDVDLANTVTLHFHEECYGAWSHGS